MYRRATKVRKPKKLGFLERNAQPRTTQKRDLRGCLRRTAPDHLSILGMPWLWPPSAGNILSPRHPSKHNCLGKSRDNRVSRQPSPRPPGPVFSRFAGRPLRRHPSRRRFREKSQERGQGILGGEGGGQIFGKIRIRTLRELIRMCRKNPKVRKPRVARTSLAKRPNPDNSETRVSRMSQAKHAGPPQHLENVSALASPGRT